MHVVADSTNKIESSDYFIFRTQKAIEGSVSYPKITCISRIYRNSIISLNRNFNNPLGPYTINDDCPDSVNSICPDVQTDQSCFSNTCDHFTCVESCGQGQGTCYGYTCFSTCEESCFGTCNPTCQGNTCTDRPQCHITNNGLYTCDGKNTCDGTDTCDGDPENPHTCYGYTCHYTCWGGTTCDGTPNCNGTDTQDKEPTCDGTSPTCEGGVTCDGTNTCAGHYTCSGLTCDRGSTCDGTGTCDGQYTCEGSTCNDGGTCYGYTCDWTCGETCKGTCSGWTACEGTCNGQTCDSTCWQTACGTCYGQTCEGTCNGYCPATFYGVTCDSTCNGPTCDATCSTFCDPCEECNDPLDVILCVNQTHIFVTPCPDTGSTTWDAPEANQSSGEGKFFTVHWNAPGYYEVTVSWEDGNCDDSAIFSVTVIAGTMTPDPETHHNDTLVTIFPGDVETVFVEWDPEDTDIVFWISDSFIAQFLDEEELKKSIQVNQSPSELTIVGLDVGDTVLSAQFCEILPIYVGGNITVEFDQLPTFNVHPGYPLGEPGATHPGEDNGPVIVGGKEVLSPGPDARKNISYDLLFRIGEAKNWEGEECSFRVEIKDALGFPKKGKSIALVPMNEYLEVQSSKGRGFIISDTDKTGRSDAELFAGSLGEIPVTDSILSENLAVLVGQSAIDFDEGILLPSDIDPLRDFQSFYNEGSHTLTGHSLRFSYEYENRISEDFITLITLDMPLLNDAHFSVCKQFLEEQIYTSYIDYRGETLSLWDWETNEYLPITIDLGKLMFDPNLNSQSFTMGLIENDVTPFLHQVWNDPDLNGKFEEMDWSLEFESIDPNDLPPGHDGDPNRIVTVGAIAADFSLAFIPGYDFVDVIKYGLWKPVFNNEPTTENYIIAGVAFLGLVADAGYLAYVAPGFVTNAIAAAFKVVVKHVPVEKITKMCIRLSGEIKKGFQILCDYANKIPKPEGFNPKNINDCFEWGKQVAVTLINQWNIILHSPLKLSANDLADSIGIINTRLTRTLTDEAAEGVAAVVKHGDEGKDAIDNLFIKIGDNGIPDDVIADSAESVSESICRSYKQDYDPFGENFVNRGKERIDNALLAAGKQLDPHLRDIAEQFIGPNKAIKSMEEFEALRFMRANDLRPDQKDAIVTIRQKIQDELELDKPGTALQKIIKGSEIDEWLGTNNKIRGFTARQTDAGTDVFGSHDEMIEGLRLDYDSGFQGEKSVGVIEFPNDPGSMDLQIPFDKSYHPDGPIDDAVFPFTGNGFTATTSGRLVPELRLSTEVTPPEGSKLWRLEGSNKTPVAKFENGVWEPWKGS